MTDLRRGMLLPSELRMIEIVHKESKWYSLNNQLVQVLWCQNFLYCSIFSLSKKIRRLTENTKKPDCLNAILNT